MGTDAIGGVTRRRVRGGGGRRAHDRAAARPRGRGFVAPSDRIGIATIGAGRQGHAVTMSLLQRQDVQLVAVCDVNRGSRDYVEYRDNAHAQLRARTARGRLRKVGVNMDLAWPRPADEELFHQPRHWRPRARRSCSSRPTTPRGRAAPAYAGCTAYCDYRELLASQRDLDAVYVATPDHWHAPIAIAAMRAGKHVLGQKPMCHAIGEARRMAAVARETKVATSVTINNPSTRAHASHRPVARRRRDRHRSRGAQLVHPSVLAAGR